MEIRLEKTDVSDVVFIIPELRTDERGFFTELFRRDIWDAAGLPTQFVQLNFSKSVKNTVRGLHFQWDPPMGKLMWLTSGQAFLVAVDIRKGSPTVGRWVGRQLSSDEPVLFWAPAGFARGFAVTSKFAEIQYLTTAIYNEASESSIFWNDPAIGITWPVSNPMLSARDAKAQTLERWLKRPESETFCFDIR